MNATPGRLLRAIQAAGVAAVDVSIPDTGNKATWKVLPANLQAAAQATIDAFDVNNPAHESAELTTEVTGLLDNARLTSAVVWVILRTIYPSDTVAQTKTKFNAQPNGARAQIIQAFKDRLWL